MGMGVQGIAVHGDRVDSCPRLAGVRLDKCLEKCKHCRGFSSHTSRMGEYQKGKGFLRENTTINVVYCDHKNRREFGQE